MPREFDPARDDQAQRSPNKNERDASARVAADAATDAPTDAHPLLALQRTLGNRWVQRQIGAIGRSASASAGPAGGPLEDDLVKRIQSERSGGQPLSPEQRSGAERALGADLSAVRVHTGRTAAELSEQIGAQAFTTGRDIFFGAGRSPADTSVLIHESAHAVQQGMSVEPPTEVGAADTAYEQSADHAAAAAPSARLFEEEEAPQVGRLVQRDESDGSSETPAEPELPNLDFGFDFPFPEPRSFTPDEIAALVPGYQPPPEEDLPPAGGSSSTAMAMRTPADGVVQRDGPPHVSGDVSLQVPWTLQASLVYRDLNLRSFTGKMLTLDLLHEPQAAVSLSTDPKGWLGASLAVPLLNLHIQALAQETEVQIAAQMNTLLAPQLSASGGGNLQVEQHIWKGFSATFGMGGFWTPPHGGEPGRLEWQGTAGVTFHLDGKK